MLRVLHVHSGNMFGGVEAMLLTMARTPRDASGIDTRFAFCFDGAVARDLRALDAPVAILGDVRFSRPLEVMRARRRLDELLARERPDVVVCHAAWALALFGKVARRAGASLAFWLHDPPEPGRLHWVERLARRTTPDVVICNSRFTASSAHRLFPRVPAHVVYCPVEAPVVPDDARTRIRAEFGARDDETVIVQVGRWERHKGHLAMLEALARVADRPGWVYWHVGRPQRPMEVEYEAEVRARAATLGIADRVRLLGWQPDVRAVLAAADVYCQPNIRPEPFGIAFVEALYAGLPVVGTTLGGPCEIITPEVGRLVPPDDAGALARVLGELLDAPPERARLSAAAPARALALSDPTARARELQQVLATVRAARMPQRRLDIGMVSYGLPVPGQKRGGIERLAHDLAQGLAERGHRVTVYAHDPAPPGAAYRVEPARGRRLARHWLGQRLSMGYLANLLNVDRRLRRHEVLFSLGDSLLMPLLGRPLVRVMCGSALGEVMTATSPLRIAHQSGVYVQELLTAALQPATVGISQNTRRHNPLVRRTIPIGADLRALHPDASARTPEPSLLFVGALGGRKRGTLLLDWFQRVIRPAYPTATLTMLSEDGPPVEGVTYRRGLPAEELAALYRSSWLYVSPSSYEGFGLPYVEAMASGTPVVCSPNPGSREVLDDGRYGVLASDECFAQEVVSLLGDRERRDRLARLGLERARTYDMATVIDQYEALLAELVDAAPAPVHRTVARA